VAGVNLSQTSGNMAGDSFGIHEVDFAVSAWFFALYCAFG
jgi:hypothetical protein